MIRKPLKSVDINAKINSVPIFDDFKSTKLTKPPAVSAELSMKKARPSNQSKVIGKLFIVMLIAQRSESNLSQKRAAFLKLANFSLHQKVSKGEAVRNKPLNTPKKRRLEESEQTDIVLDDVICTPPISHTPPRSRSNTMQTTPSSHKQASATPATSSRPPVFATPGRAPLLDAVNRDRNRSVISDPVCGTSPKKPTESLSDRLRQVEDSLQKLQVLGDLESVRAASVFLKSPSRGRIYSELKTEHGKENIHQPNVHTSAPSSSAGLSAALPNDKASPAVSSQKSNPPATAPYSGTGSALLKPQLAEHLVLQAAVQKATKASMKTLLKAREGLPLATELRDQLASYQQDSAKVATSLKPVEPHPQAESAAQVTRLEAAISHYHYTASGLFPLSPLGDQSIRGDAFSPVPLSEMSLLKDKMQSWRVKYAIKPT